MLLSLPRNLSHSFPTALASLVFLAVLAGCEVTTFTRGNMPTAFQINQIELGKTTRDDVTEALGTPTLKSTADPNFWFYTAQTIQERPLVGRELLGQSVLVVQFGDLDRVINVRQLEADVNGIIQPSLNSTNISLRERTLVEQALGLLFPGTIPL